MFNKKQFQPCLRIAHSKYSFCDIHKTTIDTKNEQDETKRTLREKRQRRSGRDIKQRRTGSEKPDSASKGRHERDKTKQDGRNVIRRTEHGQDETQTDWSRRDEQDESRRGKTGTTEQNG